jgi:hypothetical protein
VRRVRVGTGRGHHVENLLAHVDADVDDVGGVECESSESVVMRLHCCFIHGGMPNQEHVGFTTAPAKVGKLGRRWGEGVNRAVPVNILNARRLLIG